MGLALGILSIALNVNLFQEEVGGKGEAWGEVTPLQASILGVVVVCPPPHLHLPPHQLQATMAWVPTATWPGLLQVAQPTQVHHMPGWALNGHRGSHGRLESHGSVHGWLGGCKSCHRRQRGWQHKNGRLLSHKSQRWLNCQSPG